MFANATLPVKRRGCIDQSEKAHRRRLLSASVCLALVAQVLTFPVALGFNLYRALYVSEDGQEAYVRIALLHRVPEGPCFIATNEYIFPSGSYWEYYVDSKLELTCSVDKPMKAGIFFGLASLTLNTSVFMFILITRFYLVDSRRRLHEVSFRLSYWCLIAAVFTLLNLVAMGSHWCTDAATCTLDVDGILVLVIAALWFLCAVMTFSVFKRTAMVAVAPMPTVAPIPVDIEQGGNNDVEEGEQGGNNDAEEGE